MTTTTSAPAAVAVAQAYFQAWSAHDSSRRCSSSIPTSSASPPPAASRAVRLPRLHGPVRRRASSAPRWWPATETTSSAVTVYDTDTRLVHDAPGAECVRVRDGRIVWMRIIFDRLPFRDAAG